MSGLLVLALLAIALPAHPLTALAEIEQVDTTVWSYFSGTPGALLGSALSPAGDVNGDGYDDVLIGAYLYESNDNLQGEGRAYLFTGAPSGLGTEPSWTIYGGAAFAYVGWAVAGAGDVNGDGYADVAISANRCTDSTKTAGEVYVFYGGPDGPSTTANWSAIGDQAEACFGYELASAGDVNNDGFDDLLVGAPLYDDQYSDEGTVYLYYGSNAGLNSSPDRIFYGGQAYAELGISLSAGDFDNDEFSDIVLGAPGFSNLLPNEGQVQVYLGSSAGPSTDADWTLEGDQDGARYGSSVAAAGDVDGDTYPDLLVGADKHEDTLNPINNQGTAYLYLGGTGGLNSSPLWMYSGQVAGGFLGSSVSGAGDVNGDGFADLVLGASHYSDPESAEGSVFFFLGDTVGPAATPDWIHQLNQANARLGSVVGGAGDVNADGFAEIMVSAPWYETSTSNDEGLVEVFHGEADGLDETLLSFYLTPNPVTEGSPTILYGSFTVADDTESFTLTVDWGDGSDDTVIVLDTARAFDTQHTYAHAGAYVVSVVVSGSNGTTLEGTVTATVLDVPPTLDLSGASSVAEGVSYALAIGPVVDPGGSTITACQLDWDDGSPLQDCLAAIGGSLTHVFPDGPASHTISITLTDEDGTYPDVDTLAVNVTNVAPVAFDDAYTVPPDQQLVIPAPGVLANDQDVPADSLTASLVSGPGSGSLTLNANGSFTYTPQSGFVGDVSFTYRATDSDGALSNTATVTLTVENIYLYLPVVMRP